MPKCSETLEYLFRLLDSKKYAASFNRTKYLDINIFDEEEIVWEMGRLKINLFGLTLFLYEKREENKCPFSVEF